MNLLKIRGLAEIRDGGIRKLAKDIKMSEANLHRCITTNKMQAGDLEKVASIFKVPIGHFFDEENDNEKHNVDADKITKIHNPTKYMEKILETQEITLRDIKAAANLKTLFSDKNQNVLGTIQLPNIPKCDGAIYVTGDSMYPLIKSGDIVCYKEVYDFSNIVYGEMYLISMDIEGDEYLTIKYITRSEKGDGWICLKSHNELHSPKDFELKYVNALALVKISIRVNTM